MRRTLATTLAVLWCLSPAFADTVTVTARRATLHTYPAANAPVMASVSEGTRLEVESREGEWFKVRPLGEPPGSPRTGYLHSSAARPDGTPTPGTTTPFGAVAIAHKGVACLAADVYPRLEACLDPAGEVSRARVQFRATGTPHWYFVEMAKDGECHRGTLPRPLKSTASVEYYIEVSNRSFLETRTGEYRPRVVATRTDCGKMIMPPALGSATVTVGTIAVGAPGVPAGFSASGVAATAAGAPVAAPPASVAPPTGSVPPPTASLPPPTVAPTDTSSGGVVPPSGGGRGFPTKLAVIGGVLVAGGGAAAYLATRGEDLFKIDNDGDGLSEEQGDCNDRDQDIKPDGGFDFRIEFAYGNGSIVGCTMRNPAQQTYRVTNNGCETLVIESLSFTQTVAAPCTGSGGATLALSLNRVASGATVTIRQGAAPGVVAPICCPSYPCSQAPCVFNIQYTVTTSAGAKTLANSYTVTDSTGRDCPLCGSIGTDELFRGAPRAVPPGGY